MDSFHNVFTMFLGHWPKRSFPIILMLHHLLALNGDMFSEKNLKVVISWKNVIELKSKSKNGKINSRIFFKFGNLFFKCKHSW
jgi:hypothetical protein